MNTHNNAGHTDRHAGPAVMYSRIMGVAFTLAGVLGFFVNSNQDRTDQLLGLDVNLTHNFVHLGTGIVGLIAGFAVLTMARPFALGLGIVYTALAIWGLSVGDGFDPFGIFVNINMADNIFHLVVGLLGIGAWVASRNRHANNTTV